MGKILKHLSPYWKSVIVVVLLLVVQAYCDLALPTYTSDIIDTGIQNKGVEHVVPYRITEEDHAEAKLFMTADEAETWEKIYKKEGEIYTLSTTDEEELNQLDDRMIIPLVMNYQADQITEEEMAALAQSIQTVQSPEEIRGQMEQTVEAIGRETLR